MRKKEYLEGQVLGEHEIKFIKEIVPYIAYNNKKVRKALFRCGRCSSEFETTIIKVRTNHTKSCGCLINEVMTTMKTTHGLTGHPIYLLWQRIKARTGNPKDSSYKFYGGRGIGIADYWEQDAEKFAKYVMGLPRYSKRVELRLTLDRIDSNKSYIKGNLRWATMQEQIDNRRPRTDGISGHAGIYWRKEINKWVVYALTKGKRFYGGSFKILEDAVLKRNSILREVQNG
jgi:hypothetical protein